MRSQSGVPGDPFGLIPGRVTYIVERHGIIKFIFNSPIRIDKQIAEALRILKELK